MLDRTQLEQAIKSVNKHKHDIYWEYCYKNNIKFLDRFVIATKESYEEEKRNMELAGVDNGVDEILENYDLPKEVKDLIKKNVGVVSLHHLVSNEATEIECQYHRILYKPMYEYQEACSKIKYILERAFGIKYPELRETLWLYNYETEVYNKYTKRELMDKIGQVAIENMEKIDKVFDAYKITSLSGKAFMLQNLYYDAVYNRDLTRTYYEQYTKNI